MQAGKMRRNSNAANLCVIFIESKKAGYVSGDGTREGRETREGWRQRRVAVDATTTIEVIGPKVLRTGRAHSWPLTCRDLANVQLCRVCWFGLDSGVGLQKPRLVQERYRTNPPTSSA
ncbi:MAG: hypothetical protein ACPHF4_10345, partial [Rubripirellula sp.]